MTLVLSSDSVLFQGPFDQRRTFTVSLFNNNQDPVLFKIKTNNIQAYSAIPSCEWVEPGRDVEVKFIKLSDSDLSESYAERIVKEFREKEKDGKPLGVEKVGGGKEGDGDKFLLMSTVVPLKERRDLSSPEGAWRFYHLTNKTISKKLSIVLTQPPVRQGDVGAGGDQRLADVMPEKVLHFKPQRGFSSKGMQKAEITIVNRTNQSIAFKVKTRNQMDYGVRPNQGKIRARGTLKVKVASVAPITQPTDPIIESNKFLILTAPIPVAMTHLPYEFLNHDDLWLSNPATVRHKLDVHHESSFTKNASEKGKFKSRFGFASASISLSRKSKSHLSTAGTVAAASDSGEEEKNGGSTVTLTQAQVQTRQVLMLPDRGEGSTSPENQDEEKRSSRWSSSALAKSWHNQGELGAQSRRSSWVRKLLSHSLR